MADLHIGQRRPRSRKLSTIVTRGASYVPDAGIRDVAESWAGHAPRAASARSTSSRAAASAWSGAPREVLALTEGRTRSRRGADALEILGALALSRERLGGRGRERWRRWAPTRRSTHERRSDFLVAAGDIFVQHYGDSMTARTLYDRARALWPGNPSLWHVDGS